MLSGTQFGPQKASDLTSHRSESTVLAASERPLGGEAELPGLKMDASHVLLQPSLKNFCPRTLLIVAISTSLYWPEKSGDGG